MCAVADRWGIDPVLSWKLMLTAAKLPFDIQIFSGARTREQQEQLEREGRPTAPFDVSTHADETASGCPRRATGADVQPIDGGVRVIRAAIAQLGAAAVSAGLRWGGGSPVQADGIPSDFWHFDLGPRSDPHR